jgi:hypothetical protein
MNTLRRNLHVSELVEFVFRIYVFTFLNIYAVGKLLGGQFYTPETIPEEVFSTTLGMASNFDLAWTFMGRSYGYILFIGSTQLIGSWLLLFNRTKLIGCAILIPIMVNIIVFDIFFLDKYGALASACIYFSMLLFILLFNKERIVRSVKSLIVSTKTEPHAHGHLMYRIMACVVLFGLFFLLDQWLVNLLGHGKG